MPALRNPRHERFARQYIKTGVASEAFRKAGYKSDNPRSVWANACRMIGHDSVRRRITELKRQMASRNRITVDSLIEELITDRDHARRLDQPSVAVTATMSAARLVGLLVDRKEQGAPGEFAGLQSEDAVLAKVRAELGEDAALQLTRALAQTEELVTAAEALDQADEVDPPPIEATVEGSGTLN